MPYGHLSIEQLRALTEEYRQHNQVLSDRDRTTLSMLGKALREMDTLREKVTALEGSLSRVTGERDRLQGDLDKATAELDHARPIVNEYLARKNPKLRAYLDTGRETPDSTLHVRR